MSEIDDIEFCRNSLEQTMKTLIADIGIIPIGKDNQIPYGWRKAAKGRTVWRILEEVISQNLELKAEELGLQNFGPASSEVDVYDFAFNLQDKPRTYVNIKSAVKGGRTNKDDISKAAILHQFIGNCGSCALLVATIEIEFVEKPMGLLLSNCYVVPVTWFPDIYVNPSNNGNLQSSKYKDLDSSVRRTNSEFLALLETEIKVAAQKRAKKN